MISFQDIVTYCWDFHFLDRYVAIEQLGVALEDDEVTVEFFSSYVDFAVRVSVLKFNE